MSAQEPDTNPSSDLDGPPRARRSGTAAVVGLALVAVLATACGSSSSPSTSTAAPDKSVIEQSGTGNKTFSPVAVPSKWSVTWNFNCVDPVSARSFVLTSTKDGGSPVTVTDQTGLGGGGHKPITTSGTYTFAVATTCSWKLTVGPTPPTVGTATTSSVPSGSVTSRT
jgi:hypothetical protein